MIIEKFAKHPEANNHTLLLTLNLYCSAERMYRKYPSVCSDATVKINGLAAERKKISKKSFC